MSKNAPKRLAQPLLLAALVGLAGGVLAAVLYMAIPDGGTSGLPASQSTGRALIGGAYAMTDTAGRRVTEKDFAGKAQLVYFGFTNCPDICPSGLQVIAAALDKLGPKADNLTPIFVTLDPDRDTAAVLGPYVKSFSPRIVGLTGSREDVTAITKAFRVYARKTEPDERGNYSVDHSSFMYLMSPTGEFVKHFPHTIGPDELAQALGGQL